MLTNLILIYLAFSAGVAVSEYIDLRLDGHARSLARWRAGQAFVQWPLAIWRYIRGEI